MNQEGLDDHSYYPAPSFQPSCPGYEPQLAIDSATGRPYLAWFSNASARPGVLIQPVDPSTGSPQLTPFTVPGSTDSSGLRARTPLTGLPGHPGVYTAIPSGSSEQQVVMAGFGIEPHSTFITQKYVVSCGEGRVRNTAIGPDDAGHLWVVWTRDTIDGLKLSASRWDSQTGKFSTPTIVPVPPHANDSFSLDAVALGNATEVFGYFGPTTSGGMGALWHPLLSPSPTVTAARITVAKGKKATVNSTSPVAGKPLAGATVTTVGATASKVRSHKVRARTNHHGLARLRLGPFHRPITIRLLIRKPG